MATGQSGQHGRSAVRRVAEGCEIRHEHVSNLCTEVALAREKPQNQIRVTLMPVQVSCLNVSYG